MGFTKTRPAPRPEPSFSEELDRLVGPTKAGENSDRVAELKNGTGFETESSFLDLNKPPVFEGYEDDRYQQHDERIAALVESFNADKAGFIGATPDQAEGIPDIDPALVKSWLIQESGGGDKRSLAAWATDPAQVNVPGDWGSPKGDEYMGLTKPRRRNEGDVDTNLKAAMVWLARKGFSRSGAAPKDLLGGQTFGGWEKALENYNGRADRFKGKKYKEVYADKILARAAQPDEHLAINW